MARFINESPEQDLLEEEEYTQVEEEQTLEEQPAEPEEIQEQEDKSDIPEKYQNKSITDIVQMHQEAEKLLGRQSSEVGELRKVVDDFVKTNIANSPHKEEGDDLDLFENPDAYIDKKLANHPKIKEAEKVSATLHRQEVMARIQTDHPDFATIVSDAKFLEWASSSKMRTELFQRADQNFEFDAADELLSQWKERQNIVKETAEMQKTDRKRQLKSASTGANTGSGERSSRKVYRRADIIKLMQTDPDRYQELAPEIREAYAEGRVK
tara:strand:- start:2430 stop:3233 length:804 start_codon:yes stop_codon:yes gene_type:complete